MSWIGQPLQMVLNNSQQSFLSKHSLKEKHQAVGLYSFDENFQTQLTLSLGTKDVPEFNGSENKSLTNIAESIQLASNLANQQKATRIVLLSDGLENSGSVSDQLSPNDWQSCGNRYVLIKCPSIRRRSRLRVSKHLQ